MYRFSFLALALAATPKLQANEPHSLLQQLNEVRPAPLFSTRKRAPENAKKAPQRLRIEKKLEPVIHNAHDWTRYTYYFEGGSLVNSIAGLNTKLGCTVETRVDLRSLDAGDKIEILSVQSYDTLEEGCAEWGEMDGDDYCVRGTKSYFPVNSWSFSLKHPRVRRISCRKESPEARSIRAPMTEDDRINPEVLGKIFGELVSVSKP